MSGPWIIVTGGNRGLGLEMARKLLADGKSVIITTRDDQKGKGVASILEKQADAVNRVQAIQLDVDQVESLDRFLEAISTTYKGQIYGLINNAAIYPAGWNEQTFEKAKRTNFGGPLRLCVGIAPAMVKGGRIINVSSEDGYFRKLAKPYADRIASATSLDDLQKIEYVAEDPGTKTFAPAYGVCKAMLNKATQIMASMSEFEHLSINAVDPGWCSTEMGGKNAPRSPLQGRDSILAVLKLPEGASGKFYLDGKEQDW